MLLLKSRTKTQTVKAINELKWTEKINYHVIFNMRIKSRTLETFHLNNIEIEQFAFSVLSGSFIVGSLQKSFLRSIKKKRKTDQT